MSWWQRVLARGHDPPRPAAVRAVDAVASARPTYATLLSGNAILPRRQSLTLLGQFYNGVPALGRALDILASMVGCPCFEGETDGATARLMAWAEDVRYGSMGGGVGTWLPDQIRQALLYGFSVGEMTSDEARSRIETLWSYRSPAFNFRTTQVGQISILQTTGLHGVMEALNPDSVLHTAYSPEGCDPNGRSLFFSSHTFCQAWLDIAHAFRATWKRNGIPIYHVHTQLPNTLNDPDGSIGSSVASAAATQWNAAMKSQVIDGKAEDFFTANTGDTAVRVIGADGAVIDIEVSKRAVVEEIIVATGIPGWLLGYSTWSSTERLSGVQADLLMATICALRRMIEPTLRRIMDTNLRLQGRRGEPYEIDWPDVSLVDQASTSLSEMHEGIAMNARQRYYRQLWTDGIISQEQYAEEMTGHPDVDMPMDSPPGAMPAEPAQGGAAAMLLERREAYPAWQANGGAHGCAH